MEIMLQNLGPALMLLRRRTGLKQFEVARYAGTTRPMLCAYERGKQRPSLSTLIRLLNALGASFADLHCALASFATCAPADSPTPAEQAAPADEPATPPLPAMSRTEAEILSRLRIYFRELLSTVHYETLYRTPPPAADLPAPTARRKPPQQTPPATRKAAPVKPPRHR